MDTATSMQSRKLHEICDCMSNNRPSLCMIINNNVQTHVTTTKPKLPNYTHDYITTMSMIIYFLHLPSPNECLCIKGGKHKYCDD